jgi:hypothetical protein
VVGLGAVGGCLWGCTRRLVDCHGVVLRVMELSVGMMYARWAAFVMLLSTQRQQQWQLHHP